VSNAVRFDPPLVRALAAELDSLLAGRPAHPVPVFDRDLSAVLLLDGGEALRWDLHPTRGWVTFVPRPEGFEGHAPEARIVRVAAAPDERLLRIDLQEGNRFRGGARSLFLELHTNQWNALLVDGADRRIVSVLRSREAGGRRLFAGEEYAPPQPSPRLSSRATERDRLRVEWHVHLALLAPEERRVELLRSFADASPLNADSILGDAATSPDPSLLDPAFERWWAIHTAREPRPVLLELSRGKQPYPLPLEGVPAEPFPTLLAAWATLATTDEVPGREQEIALLVARARRRLEGARRRAAKLYTELQGVGAAEPLRARGDLLLANLHRVQHGASRVTVYDHEGRRIKIPMDPSLRPHENANRWFEEARRLDRIAERIPGLIERAEAEVKRWEEGIAQAEKGEPPAWMEAALRRAEQREAKSPAQARERKPYRVYRTSGGLEVRVGRTREDNDRLTFRHASLGDVWLHARSVPGSHVVLRWSDEGAPPARDLEEAATLAAWHSKARSSGTVAVDWTRRRYVRKPRGAPPGRVSILQAKTVFVAPDAELEERLREE
jgi:predicted ribosome quality control (RQC) complex YloA/Tae2 family protein